jgi:hypothetical protein
VFAEVCPRVVPRCALDDANVFGVNPNWPSCSQMPNQLSEVSVNLSQAVALPRLPDRQWRALQLKLRGYSHAEIAAEVGFASPAVSRVLLNRPGVRAWRAVLRQFSMTCELTPPPQRKRRPRPPGRASEHASVAPNTQVAPHSGTDAGNQAGESKQTAVA